LVGWNASREAARAIHDALPFLVAARQVVVATVDAAPRPGGHGEAPGFDLAAHLARHGVYVELRNVDGLGRTDGRALLDEAEAIAADMIVIGAYGRSRAEEMLFGGVTRELLRDASVPVFLSH
jgi:nucleotide-binding universal stress UspA family protein